MRSASASLSADESSIITPDNWNELSSREMFQRSVFHAMAETLKPAM